MPSPSSSPGKWFEIVDFDGNGKLDQCEVLSVVSATVPVDAEALERELPKLWWNWDIDGDGTLSFQELLGEGGLLHHVRRKFARQLSDEMDFRSNLPSLGTDLMAWFSFWDTNQSGSLEREELVRGLIRSNDAKGPRQRLEIRRLVEELWADVDTDRNGCISFSEFCREGDGLASRLIELYPGFAGFAKCKRSIDEEFDDIPAGSRSPPGGQSPFSTIRLSPRFNTVPRTGGPQPGGSRSPPGSISPRESQSHAWRPSMDSGKPVSPRGGLSPSGSRKLRRMTSKDNDQKYLGQPLSPRGASRGERRSPRGPSSPRGSIRRKVSRRYSSLPRKKTVAEWNRIVDMGTSEIADEESPSLLRRESKGFISDSFGGSLDLDSKGMGALAQAHHDLSAWALPASEDGDSLPAGSRDHGHHLWTAPAAGLDHWKQHQQMDRLDSLESDHGAVVQGDLGMWAKPQEDLETWIGMERMVNKLDLDPTFSVQDIEGWVGAGGESKEASVGRRQAFQTAPW